MAAKKIMIVDDDKEFLEELSDMLGLSGYDIVGINDSTTVINAANSAKPDLILLDLKMSGMDGFQVVEKLKQNPQTESIPVIAMTGYFTKSEHAMLVSFSGMAGCLIKPFNPLDVVGRIEAVLQRAK